MLAIGRILRTGARLLLLDEPTEGLAPVIVQQIGRTIARAQGSEGFTILLVEQNFRFAATRRRPALRDGARPRRGHDPATRSSTRTWTSCTSISACSATRSHFQRRSIDEAFKRTHDRALAIAAHCRWRARSAQVSDSVDQDRRADRHVEPVHRPGRRGLGRRRADGGRGLRHRKARLRRSRSVSADHQNKPRRRLEHRAPVVRRRQGRRRSSTCRTPASRSRSTRSRKDKGKAFLVSGAASSDLTGKACSPNTIHWTYDTWMLANGTGQRDRQDRRRHLVLPDRRLRVRPRAGARHRGGRARRTAARCWARCAHPLNTQDFSLVPAAGAGVQGEDHRPRQRRRRHHRTRSSRRPSSASSRAARTSPACWCSSPTSTRSGLPTAQGLIVTETFYWDTNDQTRAFAKRFAAAGQGHPSDDGPCRRLRGGAALPEGGRGAEERRRHAR